MVAEIENALDALAASLPDASHRMRHGDDCGVVVAASGRDLDGETVAADAPREMRRVVGKLRDFPSLSKGAAVELDGRWHLVTGARASGEAAVSVGLSAPLDEVEAVYTRPGARLDFAVRALAVESDTLDPWTDALAPTSCRAWFVAIARDLWDEDGDPRVGDCVAVAVGFGTRRLRVASVAKSAGFYVLTCREAGHGRAA